MSSTIQIIKPAEYGAICTEKIRSGAFLTTRLDDKVNSMWVNWGGISYVWRRYCCTLWLRPSRYTTEILAQNPEFTLSIPLDASHHQALRVCGKNSGRDVNKIELAEITLEDPQTGSVPIIGGSPFIHLECRVLMTQKQNFDTLDPSVKDFFYSDNEDVHVAYIAEILSAYKK